ncbi:RNA polymerase II transcription factor B subunit 2 [Neolecta irregularis DAH-3]|uniref:RNA polymerase II transcription factor B subunit 2 n=1 Tax=Neolecta irregularis (strain DAH-3) TaxID=1198029 RepID=A0A1U7LLQ9_NEOID|nr:RNA polymerase II transcription factor B subunit 2 [Neolecta irregularis DAH-3]|eukprot:OLL23595.1 RNA polymerase II transcription factor B subunit 2 [Neolecta irregularis DAH-3]
MDTVQVLHFIFMLGTFDLGLAYSTAGLSPTQSQMTTELGQYGLIYRPSASSEYFYPTKLAISLTANPLDPEEPTQSKSEQGFIILETNYKLYAYTDSPLQISILNLFCVLKARFSNMIMGLISRESVRHALSNGITAEQIIMYLTAHAHPQMRKNIPLLPPTLVDQIRLWELERNRIKTDHGYLFRDFKSTLEFNEVVQYAEQLGVVLWKDQDKRLFFATVASSGLIIEFVKRRNE